MLRDVETEACADCPNSCPEVPYSSALALNTRMDRMDGVLCGPWWVGGSSWFPSEVDLVAVLQIF